MNERRKRADGGIYLRGAVYWVEYDSNGKPVYESSKSDNEIEARKLLLKRMAEIISGTNNLSGDKVSLAELADDVVTDCKVNRTGQRRQSDSVGESDQGILR